MICSFALKYFNSIYPPKSHFAFITLIKIFPTVTSCLKFLNAMQGFLGSKAFYQTQPLWHNI